jgi:peptide/nickel transport system ATP-binding protein
VAAAKMRGESTLYIMLVEILPNARGPLIVDMCLRTGYNIIIIGVLGFLGIGLPPARSGLGRHGQGHLRDDDGVAAHGAVPRARPSRRSSSASTCSPSGCESWAGVTEPLLALQDLSIAYDGRRGDACRARRELHAARRRGAGPGGRVGLRQVDGGAVDRALPGPRRAHRGRAAFSSRAATSPRSRRRRCATCAGRRIAMVYQDPMASLNPVMTVGRQLMEVPMIHDGAGRRRARARALAMLGEVKLADPEAVMERYPHQLSGGQQQRIVIADGPHRRAGPADHGRAHHGLDVTVEAAVLDLVRELRRRHPLAILFISHNLGTVAGVCDRSASCTAASWSRTARCAGSSAIPRHPYTRGLLDCLPTLGRDKRQAPLVPIPGQLEPPYVRAAGCGFASRCAHVEPARCTAGPIRTGTVRATEHAWRACARPSCPPTRAVRPTAGPRGRALPAAPVIATEHLGKVYEPRRRLLGRRRWPVRALNDVDLAAARRQTLAIVGESGCGKSTLAKVLAGIEVASEGRVTLDGTEVGAAAASTGGAASSSASCRWSSRTPRAR